MKKIIAVLMVVLISLSVMSCDTKETITGNEWLVKQEECIDDITAFTKGMDTVYTLYITCAIPQDEFVNEISLLYKQYKILLSEYETLKTDYPVEPGTHSYVSKAGTEAVENIYKEIENIMFNSFDDKGALLAPAEMSYVYLAYKQTLAYHLSEYMTALALYYEVAATNDEGE